jgi:hypothetical protein
MFFKVIFLLGQYVKVVCSQHVWKSFRKVYICYFLSVASDSIGLAPNFCTRLLILLLAFAQPLL